VLVTGSAFPSLCKDRKMLKPFEPSYIQSRHALITNKNHVVTPRCVPDARQVRYPYIVTHIALTDRRFSLSTLTFSMTPKTVKDWVKKRLSTLQKDIRTTKGGLHQRWLTKSSVKMTSFSNYRILASR
jgi:hypothetical protein